MSARAEQLIARRDFDEDGEVTPGRNGHTDEWQRQIQDVVPFFVETEPVVVTPRFPSLELHNQLDALRRARRGDAKQVLDIDHTQAADLHVMARQLRARADQNGLGAPPHFHGVVGHETMAANNQIERALALTDTALTDDQHAESKNVE